MRGFVEQRERMKLTLSCSFSMTFLLLVTFMLFHSPTGFIAFFDGLTRSYSAPVSWSPAPFVSSMATSIPLNPTSFPGRGVIVHAKEDDLMNINGIGGVVAREIAEWCMHTDNTELIKRLKKVLIIQNTEYKKAESGDLPLQGKTFVLTGT